MKYFIPRELTDPKIREAVRIDHGETYTIDVLSAEMEARKRAWLDQHSGWSFHASSLVHCNDGTPLPAYDVVLEFERPRTVLELTEQSQAREEFIAHKEADLARREEAQKALLAEVLANLNHHGSSEGEEKPVGG